MTPAEKALKELRARKRECFTKCRNATTHETTRVYAALHNELAHRVIPILIEIVERERQRSGKNECNIPQ